MDIITKTHTEVYTFLKNEFENNEEFRNELDCLYTFYGRKLLQFVQKEEHQKYIEDEFGEVVNSLFFQGYYTMKLILNDEETIIGDDSWKLPLGVVKNEIPILLIALLKDDKLDWKTEISHEFSMNILTYIEAGYETTQEITKQISEYGAYKAFIDDSRYKGVEVETKTDMLLGSPSDLNFLSPQVYAKAQFFSKQHEVWDLFNWSAIKQEAWVGSIHLSTIPVEENAMYIIEFSLSNMIIHSEKLDLVKEVVSRIPTEIRAKLQVRLYSVSELDVLTVNLENAEETK